MIKEFLTIDPDPFSESEYKMSSLIVLSIINYNINCSSHTPLVGNSMKQSHNWIITKIFKTGGTSNQSFPIYHLSCISFSIFDFSVDEFFNAFYLHFLPILLACLSTKFQLQMKYTISILIVC